MKSSQSISILFICHGNICRSPMAEFILNHLVHEAGLDGQIIAKSAATSREEIGNDIHHGTRQMLRQHNIPFRPRQARQVTITDYYHYDYLIVMDENNLRNLRRIISDDDASKIHKLLSFTDSNRDIADPWYTGDFDTTFREIMEGCKALLQFIIHNS